MAMIIPCTQERSAEQAEFSKCFWWAVLPGALGMVDVFLLHCVQVLVTPNLRSDLVKVENWGSDLIVLGPNILVAACAIWRLRALYEEFPAGWTGRWQISLGDCVAIAIFVGISMLVWRTVHAETFPNPAALFIVNLSFLFTAALVFAHRIGAPQVVWRWLGAALITVGALILMWAGIFIELLVMLMLRIVEL